MGEELEKHKSDRILDAIKKRLDLKQNAEIEEQKVELVIFMLSGAYYAFYSGDVKEILPILKIYYVPGSPDFILGIINVRGDIQSVVDIKIFMGLTKKESAQSNRIVIAEKNEVRSGILVDSVVDVLDVPQESIKPAISTLNDDIRHYVVGETNYKGHNVVLLDVGKLFQKIIGDQKLGPGLTSNMDS